MSKCPCEDCISKAICISETLLKHSLYRCSILREYMTNEDRVVKTAEILKPNWLNDALGSRLLQIEGALKYAKNLSKKRPIKETNYRRRGKPT